MVLFLIDFKSEHKEKARKAEQNLTTQPVEEIQAADEGF
jgi:hypothetical protein